MNKINIGGGRDFFAAARAPVLAHRGACATSHPLATAEAMRILQNGGTAADAAIAAGAVQCVVEPHMTGLGGDCFALIKKSPSEPPLALNGSGWTPQKLSLTAVQRDGINEFSPHAVTVPGAVAAWRELHARFGQLPWRRLFITAEHYARDGFAVAARVAQDWRREEARLKQSNAAAVFLPHGRAPAAGDIFRLPALADTLRTIGADGGESFYQGDAARDMVAVLRAGGGAHELSDFADFAAGGATWVSPIAGNYRGWRVWECPPNGQGVVALLMLAAMDGALPAAEEPAAAFFADITRRAYAWRDETLGEHTRKDWAAFFAEQGAALRTAAPPSAMPPDSAGVHKDTVYIAAIDGNGMAVSFINSIFYPFGSGILAPTSGVLLQNRGLSLSLLPHSPNVIAVRKRPLHTIIPAIAEQDGDTLVFGIMGGHYQAAGQAWFLSKLLDDGADLQTAMDAPRFFAYPDKVQIEPSFAATAMDFLRRRGYSLAVCEQPLGGGQAILRRADGLLVAVSDSRKDGMAAGC